MKRMVGWRARATVAAAALLLGTASGEAQDINIGGDDRVVEGNTGTLSKPFNVNLSGPSSFTVTVSWRTIAGSATGSSDFVVVTSGFLTFNPGSTSPALTPSVQIQGDTVPEWSSTLQQDEVFFVELFNPVNATIGRGQASFTIVDNDVFQPGVQFLSAVTDSTGTGPSDGRNRLQWRVAAASTVPTQIAIAWTSGPIGTGCTPPTSDTAGEAPGPVLLGPAGAGNKQMWSHDFSVGPGVQVPRVYCYSVFTKYPSPSAERGEVITKTFDSTPGPVKWTYSPGYYGNLTSQPPAVLPPTVGPDALYTVSTDGVVHAMLRGDSGGLWPLTWNPVALGKPAHNRSPVVPFSGTTRLFVGTENGEVHAVDGRTGLIAWSRSALFGAGSAQLMLTSAGAQAPPAGLFKTYGGLNDMLLVGTANGAGNTKFFALKPANGALIDEYPGGGDTPPGAIDNVYGMAVVDYGANRVYFGSAGGGVNFTVWSLDLGPMGAPNLTLTPPGTLAWNPKLIGGVGGTVGSLVLRGGYLYLGTDSGAASAVHSLCIGDGTLNSYVHGDGQAKGFTWPDRRDGRLYFSTTSKVHAIRDDGSGVLSAFWGAPLTFTNPSIVLQRPGTDDLYIGDGLGRLVKINATSAVQTPLPLDGPGVMIGAPSLDNFHNLVHVGSDKGVIYAVRF